MERSIRKISARSVAGEPISGIGTGYFPGAPLYFMPTSVDRGCQVRLFVKERPGDLYYREQPNWRRKSSASELNISLSNLKPYSSTPDARKEFYGHKLRGNVSQ